MAVKDSVSVPTIESFLAVQPLIDEIAQQARLEFTLDSIIWGVIVQGRMVMSGATGNISDTNTRYRIASMTKSFTAAAVLSLRDEGVLSLEVPVATYAPILGAVVERTYGNPITLRHLLTMSSGLTADDPWADRYLDISDSAIEKIYADGVEFAFPTGTHFEYSNLGFALIGHVVQRLTGRRVRDLIDERLLQPLGMKSTTWDPPTHHVWAPPTRIQDGLIISDGLDPLGDGHIAPMGGLWSTVADIGRWIAWLDEANLDIDSLTGMLSAASRRDMQTMHTYAGVTALDGVKAPIGYGFGLMIRDDADLGMILSHSGGLPGYGSNMRWLQGRGIGVVAVSNTTYAPMSTLTQRILKMFHSASLIPAVSIEVSAMLQFRCDQLITLLNDWSNDAAEQIFADNVILDESFERRCQAAQQLIDACGPLTIESIHATSRTAGTIHVCGSIASKKIEILLAPLRSGPIQWFRAV